MSLSLKWQKDSCISEGHLELSQVDFLKSHMILGSVEAPNLFSAWELPVAKYCFLTPHQTLLKTYFYN